MVKNASGKKEKRQKRVEESRFQRNFESIAEFDT